MRTLAASQLVLATAFLTGALPSLSAAAPVVPGPDPNAAVNPAEQARQRWTASSRSGSTGR